MYENLYSPLVYEYKPWSSFLFFFFKSPYFLNGESIHSGRDIRKRRIRDLEVKVGLEKKILHIRSQVS